MAGMQGRADRALVIVEEVSREVALMAAASVSVEEWLEERLVEAVMLAAAMPEAAVDAQTA